MRLRTVGQHAVVLVAYALVAVAFLWPLPLQLASHLPGEAGGDTGVYVWNQWVFQHEIRVERSSPLTTARVLSLSTAPIDLTQHNYTVFLDVLAAPLIPWLGVVATYNVTLLLMLVLTGYMGWLYARHVSGGAVEGWLGGLLIAFSPALIARTTGHASLVAAAPLPAFLLALRRAGATGRLGDAALAGASVAWAALCDPYYAVFCVMAGGLYIGGRLLHVQWRPGSERPPGLWVIDLLALLMAGLIVGLMLGGGRRFDILGVPISVRGLYTPVLLLTLLLGLRATLWLFPRVSAAFVPPRPLSVQAVVMGTAVAAVLLSPVLYGVSRQVLSGAWVTPGIAWRSSPAGLDALALVAPNPAHPVTRWLLGDAQSSAPTLYVEYTGALSLVALGVLLVAWRRGFRPPVALVGVTAFWLLLALGPFIHLGGVNTHVPGPWALLRYVPVVGLARMPTRFVLMALVPFAALFALALVHLGRRSPDRRRTLLVTVGLVLAAELLPAPRPLYSAAIPSLYDIVRDDPRPVRILELPFGVRDGVSSTGNFRPRYQFNQTRHGKRLIGGYLSRVSPQTVRDLTRRPVLDALVRLSAGERLPDALRVRAAEAAPEFVARTDIGWVLMRTDLVSSEFQAFAERIFALELVAEEGTKRLYRPTRLTRPFEPGRR